MNPVAVVELWCGLVCAGGRAGAGCARVVDAGIDVCRELGLGLH